MKTAEAAHKLGVSDTTVRRWISTGKLSAKRDAWSYDIEHQEVSAALARKLASEPKAVDLAWAAGFLEGEGTFHRWCRIIRAKEYSYPRVKAAQVNREPLERFVCALGGSICRDRKNTSTRQEIWCWSLTGIGAAQVMKWLLPYMSEKRKTEITRAFGES